MRMYLKFREEMFRKNFEGIVAKNSPVTLYDFSRHDDAIDAAQAEESGRQDGWRISDDGVIGGYSSGKVDMIRTSADYKRWMAGQELKDVLRDLEVERRKQDSIDAATATAAAAAEENGKEKSHKEEVKEGDEDDVDVEVDNVRFIPFLRWSGYTDTTVGITSDAMRSGFCAIRAAEYPYGGADLQGKYNALEIICRTDGRIYTVNLKVASFFPGDMYQGYINIPATHPDKSAICPETGGDFERLVLPFHKFVLTAYGRMRDYQRTLDNNVEVQHVGFTLMDGKDGKFEFDLARIRAVNFDGYNILGEEGESEPVRVAR